MAPLSDACMAMVPPVVRSAIRIKLFLQNPEPVHAREDTRIFVFKYMPMTKVGGARIAGKPPPISVLSRDIRLKSQKYQTIFFQECIDGRKLRPGFLHMEKKIAATADAKEIARSGDILAHFGIQ